MLAGGRIRRSILEVGFVSRTKGTRSAVGGVAPRQVSTWLSERDLAQILKKITPFVMPPVSTDALRDVANLVHVILALDIPGDLVECGTWRGGTAFLMAELLRQAGVQDRKVWLFDSFEGMPPVEEIDGAAARAEVNHADSFLSPEKSRSRVEDVQRAANELGLGPYTECVKGWFTDTLPNTRQRVGPIALLHIDCDWYSSCRCCLDNLYDQVVDRGFVFLDDYYHYDGFTIAVHEFLAERRLPYRIESVEGKEGGCDYYYAARFRKGDPNWKSEYLLFLAAEDIRAISVPERAIIVVGEDLRGQVAKTRRAIPFLEHDGEFWGSPPDDQTAIRELERLRVAGAELIAFGFASFWWLDEYAGLTRHLKTRYTQVLSNDRLHAFDLRAR